MQTQFHRSQINTFLELVDGSNVESLNKVIVAA